MNFASSTSVGEAPKEATVFHFVAPGILAELFHLSLASQVTFEETRVVSGGAYGDISKGSCPIGGRGRVHVAIKRLRFYMKEDIKLLFEKEIYVWSKLRHENILPLLGFAVDDATGYPLLVSEWMNNGSAWQYVKSHQDCDLIRLATGVASGLAYLHGSGIVHSDIKSDNILVSDAGDALICDFGCSRMITASRSMANISSGIKGSLRYLACELLTLSGQAHENSTHHTPQTDVWAFGMTLYELFTLQRPYSGLSDVQVISAIIMRQLPSFPSLWSQDFDSEKIDALKSICLACWNHDPASRPNMEFFLDLLKNQQRHIDADGAPGMPKSSAKVSGADLQHLAAMDKLYFKHLSDIELNTPESQNSDIDTNYADSNFVQGQVLDIQYATLEKDQDLHTTNKMEALVRALETPSPDLSFSQNIYSGYIPNLPGPSVLDSSPSNLLRINLQLEASSAQLDSSLPSNKFLDHSVDIMGSSMNSRFLRVLIMGAGAVGKTALVRRFFDSVLPDYIEPTIEDEYDCNFSVDGEQIQISLVDTAGCEEYSTLNESWIMGTAFILVFDVSYEYSFAKVIKLRQLIYQIKGHDSNKVPIVIVGNKSDKEQECKLNPELIKSIVKKWGLPFYVTSAKNNWNVNDVFEGLAGEDRKLHPIPNHSSPSLPTPSRRNSKCIIM